MQNLDLDAMNGVINIENRTDGGIGIYYSTEDGHNTIMVSHDQLIKMTGWLVNYIAEIAERNRK